MDILGRKVKKLESELAELKLSQANRKRLFHIDLDANELVMALLPIAPSIHVEFSPSIERILITGYYTEELQGGRIAEARTIVQQLLQCNLK